MEDKPFNTNQITIIAVLTVCFVISALSVVLRLITRRVTAAKLWWDDWTAILALVFSWLTNIFLLISVRAGLGRHFSDLSHDDLILFGISFWVQELTWTLAMFLVVQSILLFYKRLFPVKLWLRRSIWIITGLMVGWTISTFLVLAFQCTPVAFFWDRSIPNGHCIDAASYYFTNGTLSMLTVLIVLCLPLPVLWNLHISNAKKWGLTFSFTVGLFVCAMSVARLVAIHQIDATDLPWTAVYPGMWSCLETNFGVVSACLPSLTPLLRYVYGKHKITKHSHQNYTRQRDGKPGIQTFGSAGKPGKRPESLEDMIESRAGCDRDPGFELRERLDNSLTGIVVTRQVDMSESEAPTKDDGIVEQSKPYPWEG